MSYYVKEKEIDGFVIGERDGELLVATGGLIQVNDANQCELCLNNSMRYDAQQKTLTCIECGHEQEIKIQEVC